MKIHFRTMLNGNIENNSKRSKQKGALEFENEDPQNVVFESRA